jgi:hypothetical protein
MISKKSTSFKSCLGIVLLSFLVFFSSCNRCRTCKANYQGQGQSVIKPEFEFCGEALKKVEGGEPQKEWINNNEVFVIYNCD